MTEPTQTQPTPTETPKEKQPPKQKEDWKQRALDAEAKLAAQPASNVQSPKDSLSPALKVEPQAPTHDHKHEDCPTCNKSVGEHFVRQTEPYCPTCGDKNPNFKSLAVCSDCGLSLGTKEHALTLEGCPNCGGKKAKEFKYK